MPLHRLAPLAPAAITGIAFAGIAGPPTEFTSMQVARGYLDVADPFGSGISTATIASPPPGSFLLLGSSIPNVERFLSVLAFAESLSTPEGHLSTFEFRNEVEVDPFAPSDFEFAFAGNRLQFDVAAPTAVTIAGAVSISGGGALFAYDYADPQGLFIMDIPLDAFTHSFTLGAGSHTIAWGVLSAPEGGSGDWEGSASVLVIPAPGAAALLAIAGLVLGRRRAR